MSKYEDITVEQRLILRKFRDAVSDILKLDHDDKYLLKWLRARNFDLSKSEAMLRKSYKFIYNIGADDLMDGGYKPHELAKSYVPLYFLGCDNEGSPFNFAQTGLIDFAGLTQSLTAIDVMKYFIYFIQTEFKTAKEQAAKTGKFNRQLVWLFDYTGINIRTLFDKAVIARSIYLLRAYQSNFPELLKVAYIINVPSALYTAFQVFRPAIHDDTWKKIKFYSTDNWKQEITQHVDLKLIPKSYGGSMDDGDMDPAKFLQRTNGGKVPIERYLTDHSYLRTTDPDIKTIVLPERKFYRHNLNVQQPGTVIKWIFETKDYDIKFGVFFKSSGSFKCDSLGKKIVISHLVDSHIVPERGELRCDNIGNYCLQFDNTYSVWTKKRLLLKVDLQKPS